MKKYYLLSIILIILSSAKCDVNNFLLPLVTNNAINKNVTQQIIKDSEGKIFRESSLVNMKKNGIEKKYYPNGKISAYITYQNGKIISIFSFDQLGNPCAINAYSPKADLEGPSIYFHTNGLIKSILIYENETRVFKEKSYNELGEESDSTKTNIDKYNIKITTNSNGVLELSGEHK